MMCYYVPRLPCHVCVYVFCDVFFLLFPLPLLLEPPLRRRLPRGRGTQHPPPPPNSFQKTFQSLLHQSEYG